jgi:hypothetical protein
MTKRAMAIGWLGLSLLASFAIGTSGCGPTYSNVSRVTGRVTLDGEPLGDAQVMFIPVAAGRPSVGLTDREGMYQLDYTYRVKGAEQGMHTVRVTTAHTREDGSTGPERVPASYNRNSTLQREVIRGSNTVDLDLASTGKTDTKATTGK